MKFNEPDDLTDHQPTRKLSLNFNRYLKKACFPAGLSFWKSSLGRPAHSYSRLQHDLDAFVLLVLEHLVVLGRVVERHLVRDDEARVDLPVPDFLE